MQIVLASLNEKGRAAIVLDTGAASRGSGNANTNKEKDVRRWFVDQDLIEGVIYLPENLFYNTTAPGIILILNKTKPRDHKGKLFLINASRNFTIAKPLFTDSGRGGFVRSCGHEMLLRFASTGGGVCSRWWQQGRSGSAVSGG